jgi:hypothetical protein
MIGAKVMNPNEARQTENRPPYAGGEVFANPATTSDNSPINSEKTKETPKETDISTQDVAKRHSELRVAFHLGGNARHKAKNPNSFITWIDGGLELHRSESRDLLGDDAIVINALKELRGIAETASKDDLQHHVNEWATNLERR